MDWRYCGWILKVLGLKDGLAILSRLKVLGLDPEGPRRRVWSLESGACGVCGAERERERERECEPEFVSGFFPGLYIRKFRELFTMNFTIKKSLF